MFKKRLLWFVAVNTLCFVGPALVGLILNPHGPESPIMSDATFLKFWSVANAILFFGFWLEHLRFRGEFVISFGKWTISKSGALKEMSEFAKVLGQACIEEIRLQQLLASTPRQARQERRLREQQIEECGRRIEEHKEAWRVAKQLFLRKFPWSRVPHWSDEEPMRSWRAKEAAAQSTNSPRNGGSAMRSLTAIVVLATLTLVAPATAQTELFKELTGQTGRETNAKLDQLAESDNPLKAMLQWFERDGFQLAKGADAELSADEQRAVSKLGRVPSDEVVIIAIVARAFVEDREPKDGERVPDLELQVEYRGVGYVGGKVRVLVYQTYAGIPGMR